MCDDKDEIIRQAASVIAKRMSVAQRKLIMADYYTQQQGRAFGPLMDMGLFKFDGQIGSSYVGSLYTYSRTPLGDAIADAINREELLKA